MAVPSRRLGRRSFFISTLLLASPLFVPRPADAFGASHLIEDHHTSMFNGDASYETLLGVAATSSSNAWSVGYSVNPDSNVTRTLIERWDDGAWRSTKSPNVGNDFNILYGVTATSSRAWAVGDFVRGGDGAIRTLIERWDGTSWRRQESPSVGSNDNSLFGVAATSPTNAWAVGNYDDGSVSRTLIEHWDGTSWRRQPSLSVGSNDNHLFGVVATSPTNAWAVGNYYDGNEIRTLVEHWNGNAWRRQPSPSPSTNENSLFGVTATSRRNAWAAGYYHDGTGYRTLIERWDGTSWKVEPSPNVGNGDNFLSGVAATSPVNAWAVGEHVSESDGSYRTLIEQWNGTGWMRLESPSPSTDQNSLGGVAATSPINAWAVGSSFNGVATRTLVEHWDGTAWKRQDSP